MKYSVWHWLQRWYDILALTIMQRTAYYIHALAIRHNIGTCPRACSPRAWCQYLTCSPCTRSIAGATSCFSFCSPVLCVWLWCWTAPCTEVSQAVIPLIAFKLAWHTHLPVLSTELSLLTVLHNFSIAHYLMCWQPCTIVYLAKRMAVRLRSSRCKCHVYQESSASPRPTKQSTSVTKIVPFTTLVLPHNPPRPLLSHSLKHVILMNWWPAKLLFLLRFYTLSGVVVGVRLGQEAKQRVRETVKYELEHFTPPVYQDMYE